MAPPVIKPPFTFETAKAKVQAAQEAWNTRDPERVALANAEDSDWRNRDEFFQGREARLSGVENGRRNWTTACARSFGAGPKTASRYELWEFDDQGLMRRRMASINDVPIAESDRKIS